MDKSFCIFDLDGTLVDSMSYWRGLEFDYLRSHGAQQGPKLDALVERLKPMTLIDAGRAFIEELNFSGTPESIAADMNAVMREHYRLRVPLKDGVADYLKKLHDRGVRMCVASATESELVRTCLTRLEVEKYFEFILSCVDVGASKDRPDVYFEAARRLGAKPGEAAAFEDSLSALRTAKAAGFYSVAVYDDFSRDDWPTLQNLADECITSWPAAAAAL